MRSAWGPGHWTGAVRSGPFAMRAVWCLSICLALVVACRKPQGTILGKAPAGEPRSILSVKAGDAPPHVTLSGVMIEKCPVAGCWFRLRDRTDTIKVDTKLAGFVVVNVPLQSSVTVSGKVTADGEEIILEASGIRY